MYFGPDTDDAYAFVLGVAGWMANTLNDEERVEAHDALRANIAAHDHGQGTGVLYDSAAWIITARKA